MQYFITIWRESSRWKERPVGEPGGKSWETMTVSKFTDHRKEIFSLSKDNFLYHLSAIFLRGPTFPGWLSWPMMLDSYREKQSMFTRGRKILHLNTDWRRRIGAWQLEKSWLFKANPGCPPHMSQAKWWLWADQLSPLRKVSCQSGGRGWELILASSCHQVCWEPGEPPREFLFEREILPLLL